MGEMADYYMEIGWDNMCFGQDEGSYTNYEAGYHHPHSPTLTLAQWIDLQRGRPQDVFNDGFAGD